MSTHYSGASKPTMMQRAALVVALVFGLVGILGFIPGITTDYDQMKFAGPNSNAMLLGLFCVSVLHNIVHLLFGVVGLALARSWDGARAYLIGGGLIYLVLAIYGALIDRSSNANFVPIDVADNWLHLALAILMIGLALVLAQRDRVESPGVNQRDVPAG